MADLSVQQETALIALAGGAHVMEAAQAAGVRRETVSRWKADPAFADELRRRRERRWAEHEDQLIKMVGECLDGLYVLTRGPDYYGSDADGRSFYDPRVRLDAIRLVLSISGLLPQSAGLQINNLLAQQVTATTSGQSGIGNAPTEPDDVDVTPARSWPPIREVNE